MTKHHLTAIIEREGDGYVSLCPELDIASQGDSVESARHNLSEAVDLFFEMRLTRGSRSTALVRGIRHAYRGTYWVSSGFYRAKRSVRSWGVMDSANSDAEAVIS